MSKVERFEDLQVWQMAHDLSVTIYSLTRDGAFSKDWGLQDQIQRASVSVMSNIAEGFERYSRQEFKQFLSIARGSCAEVRSQIQLAKSLGYVANADCLKIYEKCISLSRAIGGLRSSLDRRAKE
jgi:four helix bundle protein